MVAQKYMSVQSVRCINELHSWRNYAKEFTRATEMGSGFVWKIIDPCAQVFFRFVFSVFLLLFRSSLFVRAFFYYAFLFEISGKSRQKNIRCVRSKHRHEYRAIDRVALGTWYHCTVSVHTFRRIIYNNYNINSIPWHGDEGLSVLRTSRANVILYPLSTTSWISSTPTHSE